MKRIYVIGAGISGLSTAFFLKQRFANHLADGAMELHILEPSSRAGGHIRSVRDDGFVFEAGPRGFLSNGYYTLRLADALGILDQVLVSEAASRKRYLWFGGRLHLLPTNPIGALTSPLIGFRTVGTIVGEYWRRNSPVSQQETLAQFFGRRFSADLVENLLDPVISGIYAGNVHTLQAEAVFESMVMAERRHGSIIRGLMKNRKSDEHQRTYRRFGRRALLTFQGGLETLTQALARDLSRHLRLNAEVLDVQRMGSVYKLKCRVGDEVIESQADALIFCSPAFTTARMLRELAPVLAAALDRIPYAPIAVVSLGYRNYAHALDGFGFLAARNQNLTCLGALWNSSIFPSLSPPGSTSITVMLGGAHHRDIAKWPDEQICEIVDREMRLTLGLSRAADVVKLFRYERGIPQYDVGHLAIRSAMQTELAKCPRVYLRGNFVGGIGVNDCTRNAFELVRSWGE